MAQSPQTGRRRSIKDVTFHDQLRIMKPNPNRSEQVVGSRNVDIGVRIGFGVVDASVDPTGLLEKDRQSSVDYP